MLRSFFIIIFLFLSGCEQKQNANFTSNILLASENPDSFKINCESLEKNIYQELNYLEFKYKPKSSIEFLNEFDNLFIELGNSYGIAQLFSNVHPDEKFRLNASDCQKKFQKIFTKISLSVNLYNKLSRLDIENEDELTQRHFNNLISDYKSSGVDRDENTRKKIATLQLEISELGQSFSKNIRDDVRSITINDNDLKGLPQDYINSLIQNKDGEKIISTDYPIFLPFMKYSDSDNKRKEIYQQFLNRGYPENKNILFSLIKKRHELSNILGHPNYASFATKDAMIKNVENAENFIEKISEEAKQRSNIDYKKLLKQLKLISPEASTVNSWQKSYLEQLLKKQEYNLDSKIIREYLPYEGVKNGIFDLVKYLFDLDITEWETNVWDSSVTAHKLISSNGDVLGYFYLDMHPRKGKYKHAAHFGINLGIKSKQMPVSALICNFPGGNHELDNSGNSLDHGLMEHNQVETFLHEFGHLLHSLIGGHHEWSSLSGISTERDFVEAPSQLLEEWAWNYESLKQFAINKDGNVIPRELVDKLKKSRNFGKGTHTRNQMFYAALSLKYYSTDPSDLDLDETLINLQKRYSPFQYMPNTYFYSNFGHLYGYSARYYTYMWSKVIAADLFSIFEDQGVMNQNISKKYMDKVLSVGGSKDANDIVIDFLGRPFNYDAFIKNLNAE